MPPIPLRNSHFTLDVSGIAGFLGASQAISGMESVHFYKYRQFLGFHNTPGSYNTAQHYGKLARGAVWDGLFPGNTDEPAIFLGLDGKRGPKYRSVASGTEIIDIGHVGYILSQFCRGHVDPQAPIPVPGDETLQRTNPIYVTIVRLQGKESDSVKGDEAKMERRDAGGEGEADNSRHSTERMDTAEGRSASAEGSGSANERVADNGANYMDNDAAPERSNAANESQSADGSDAAKGTSSVPATRVQYPANIRSSPWTHALALFASLYSIAGCIVCGVYGEWFAFALILLGIVCNGIACLLIGTAQIFLRHPRPSRHSPPGDGLLDDGEQFIVLKGSEKAVNYVVKGRIVVEYGGAKPRAGSPKPKFHHIGVSAMLLTIQFIAQLFIIPRSRLFGQIIFLSTLAVSWLSNCSLSSINKEELQMMILLNTLPFSGPAPEGEDDVLDLRRRQSNFAKFQMPSRTSAVVFAMLCALPMKYFEDHLDEEEKIQHIREVLLSSLPKNTPAWAKWMEHVPKIVELLLRKHGGLCKADLNGLISPGENKLTEVNSNLLQTLLEHAKHAYNCFVLTHNKRSLCLSASFLIKASARKRTTKRFQCECGCITTYRPVGQL